MRFYPIPLTLPAHMGIAEAHRPVFYYHADATTIAAFQSRMTALKRWTIRDELRGQLRRVEEAVAEVGETPEARKKLDAARAKLTAPEFAGVPDEAMPTDSDLFGLYASTFGDVLVKVSYRDPEAAGERIERVWPESSEGRVAFLRDISPQIALGQLLALIEAQRADDKVPKS